MKKRGYCGIAAVLCLAMLTACSTGNPELDEMVSNTLITAAGTIGDPLGAVEDTVTENAGTTDVTTAAENTDTVENDAVEDTTVGEATSTGEWQGYKSPKYVYLQALLEEKGCLGGMSYVSEVGSDWDAEYLKWCVANYDRISEYSSAFEDAGVVFGEGESMYAFMPCDGAYITVYPSEIAESGEYVDDLESPLYVGAIGEPVLLRCNFGDTYSNVLVTVSDSEATYELHPTMPERHYVMGKADGWYDFGPLDYCSIEDEAFEWFKSLYGYYYEDALLDGWSFEKREAFYLFDHNVVRFGLYPNDENAVAEGSYGPYEDLEFAVDADHTYMLTIDGTMLIGVGPGFESVEEAEAYVAALDDYSEGGVG